MSVSDELNAILDRIAKGQHTDADIETLRQLLVSGDRQLMLQLGKFNVNIGEGKDIHIGDRIYQSVDVEKIQEILVEILQKQDRDQLPIKTHQDYRNREILLDRVYRSWVEGCLEQSLYRHIQINLGLEKRQNAVDLPWGTQDEPCRNLPQGTRIIEQFDSLGAGRHLLILGQPGAGKTTALLELAKDLIKRAKEDHRLPIPVIFQLSTWKNPKQSLEEWLVAELYSKYTFLDTISRPWIKKHQLLLLLDGLDEVRAEQQATCLEIINQFIDKYGQTEMVVCSRMNDYENLPVRLKCDAALSIQPLNSEQIDQCLQVLGAKSQGIHSAIQTDPILAELAKTPLFLWIMSLTYEGVSAKDLPQKQNNKEQIQRLFDQYIDRMTEPPDKGQRYPYPQTNKKRSKQDKHSHIYTKEETLAWLQFLAKRLNQESNSIFLIEELNPNWLPPNVSPWLYRLGVGLVAGLIMEWVYGLPIGLIKGSLSLQMLSGLMAGLSLGALNSMNSDIKLFDSLGWSWSWARAFKSSQTALLSIPVTSIVLILLSLTSISPSHFSFSILVGLFTGLVAAITSGCFAGLVETKPKEKERESINSNRGIWRSVQKSVAASVVTFILVLSIALLIDISVPFSVVLGSIGLYAGGLVCFQHLTIRALFWETNNAPWNYAHFLNYATERLLLNRVGGGYLFIHNLLRQNLATQKTHLKVSWQFYCQQIIVGVLIGVICLISILLPTAINSWRVNAEMAQLFFPRLQVGDRLLTDRLSPRIGRLSLEDIITFKGTPEMIESLRDKKINGEVIGCPGDIVSIKEGKIMINEKHFSNIYLKITFDLSEKLPRTLSDNTYLVISRINEKIFLTVIPVSYILEKAIWRIWPTFESIYFIKN